MAPVLGGWKLWPWHFCILQVSSVWPRPSLSQCAQATWLLNGRAFCPDCRGVSGSRTGNRSGARSGKREGTPPRSLPTRHTRLLDRCVLVCIVIENHHTTSFIFWMSRAFTLTNNNTTNKALLANISTLEVLLIPFGFWSLSCNKQQC